jgi:hypothetical protein
VAGSARGGEPPTVTAYLEPCTKDTLMALCIKQVHQQDYFHFYRLTGDMQTANQQRQKEKARLISGRKRQEDKAIQRSLVATGMIYDFFA